ncbi:MAG: ice-binding family protein [Bacteroidota bacterium]|nr:ice-binding family protein [Bacteroidota bacterium]
MKLIKILPALAVLLVVIVSGCSKSMDASYGPEVSAVSNASDLDSEASLLKAAKIPKVSALQVVNLGVAGEFVILSKAGITNVYKSSVTGDVGSSPITGAAILLRCNEVTGTIYSVDAAGPLPCRVTNASRLTTAVSNMQTAYTDAAGRTTPKFVNLGGGNIGGKTLTPGLYKFTSAVVIPTNITISGSSTDVWIFQIAGTLKMSSAVRVTLTGGALAKNIFWQTSGAVTLGTTSHFEGNILSQTAINLQTGASINGRMLAQTAVTLQMNTVKKP